MKHASVMASLSARRRVDRAEKSALEGMHGGLPTAESSRKIDASRRFERREPEREARVPTPEALPVQQCAQSE
jgi:hypothetical protein